MVAWVLSDPWHRGSRLSGLDSEVANWGKASAAAVQRGERQAGRSSRCTVILDPAFWAATVTWPAMGRLRPNWWWPDRVNLPASWQPRAVRHTSSSYESLQISWRDADSV